MSQPPASPRKWTEEEDEKLLQLVSEYGDKNWTTISGEFQKRTPDQIRQRWQYCVNPDIVKRPWTAEEDKILLERQSLIGNKWAQIAEYLPGRTSKAIRDRWRSISRSSLSAEDKDEFDDSKYESSSSYENRPESEGLIWLIPKFILAACTVVAITILLRPIENELD